MTCSHWTRAALIALLMLTGITTASGWSFWISIVGAAGWALIAIIEAAQAFARRRA